MFRHFSSKARKNRKQLSAQAMVEFALVLPILLTIIYGLIESGRLIFIYASVVTASREAARYGSASGTNASGTPLYQDCTGIRAAAQKVGFLNTFANSDIKITYDRDLGSTRIQGVNSTPGADTCPIGSNIVQNGDRIIVQVTTQFSPMILVGTFAQFPITITSTRTMLVSIPINVAAPPGSSGSGFVLSSISPSPSTFSSLGQTITYTYTLTNQGTAAISGPFTVTDNRLPSVNCPGGTNPLAGGATMTCTGTYTITQADLDFGSMTDSASALGGAGASNVATATITANQQPQISLAKSASPTASTTLGATITYSYTIQNTSNVTLPGPFTISDNKINGGAASTCATVPAPGLAPGASTSCQNTYSITSADLSNGSVMNTATAATTTTANKKTVTVTSNQASATVVTKPLSLTLTPSPTSASLLGTVITYTYTLRNNSTSSISGPFSVADNKVPNVDCSGASNPLAAGGSTSCTGTYAVTQADLDLGTITNQATATGGGLTSNQASTFVTLTQNPALTLTKGASPTTAITVGVTITYTYTLQNTGNVTLTSPYVITDNKITGVTCSGAASPLAPTASTTCSKTYVTTQTDLDAGSIINTASATAMFGAQTVTSSQASATVITYTQPRLKLQKTASPTTTTGTGQTITYAYTLTNTGNTALTSPTITDNKINGGTAFTCGTTMDIGATTSCISSYTTTTADVTAGSVTNTATAQAMAGTTPITSNSASATVTVMTPSPCDLRHGPLTTAPFAMTIYSYPSTTVTVHISSIQIYYNSNGNSISITQLSFGNVNIWSGTKTGSPGVFNSPYTGDVSLSPSSNKILQVQFSPAYQPFPSPPGGEEIVITFAESGCPILDSSNTNQLP